jgi:hypothetical protein
VHQGEIWDGITKFKMSPELSRKMRDMLVMPEEKMNGMSIEEFFGDTFEEFKNNPTWECFHTMLAFKDYHSMIEMKRYMIRFIQFQPRMERSGRHPSYKIQRIRFPDRPHPSLAPVQGRQFRPRYHGVRPCHGRLHSRQGDCRNERGRAAQRESPGKRYGDLHAGQHDAEQQLRRQYAYGGHQPAEPEGLLQRLGKARRKR